MPIYEDKSFKDYVNSLPAATENDLSAGNNMPLVRADDVKGLPGKDVAKASDVDFLKKSVCTDVNLNNQSYWLNGGINSNNGVYSKSYTDRLVTDVLRLATGQSISFTKGVDVNYTYALYCYDENGDYLGFVGSSNVTAAVQLYPSAKKFRFGLNSIAGIIADVSNLAGIIVVNNVVAVVDVADMGDIKEVKEEIASLGSAVDTIFDDKIVAVPMNEPLTWKLTAIDDNGEDIASASTLSTRFIKFVPGSTLSFTRKSGVSCSRMTYCYGAGKNYLGKISAASINDMMTRYPGATFFKVCLTNITGAEVEPDNLSNIASFYGTQNEYVDGVNTELSAIKRDVLYGKKWYACGDSFTKGVTDDVITEIGPYQGRRQCYPFYVGNRTGMEVHNIAVVGSTIAYKENFSTAANCFSFPGTGKYLSIPADADYITLKFGINDDPSHNNIPLGDINDTENTTLYGAWNVVVSHLINKCPFAKIGVIVTNGCNVNYSKAARDIAEKWGLSYLDENFDYKVPLLIRVTGKPLVCNAAHESRLTAFRVSETNTHPNGMAHLYESSIVEHWLRSL